MYNITTENGKITRSRKISKGAESCEEIEVFTQATFALCKLADHDFWLTAESALAQAHPGNFVNHCIRAINGQIYIWNGTFQTVDSILKSTTLEEKRTLASRIAMQVAACGEILSAKQSCDPADQLEASTKKHLEKFFTLRCLTAQHHYLAARCDAPTHLCIMRNDELLYFHKNKYVKLASLLKAASEARVNSFLKSLVVVAAELHYIITAVSPIAA